MGLEIGIGWLSLLLFGSLAVLLMLGLPMAFCTGSLAIIFLYVFGTGGVLNMLPSRVFPPPYCSAELPANVQLMTMGLQPPPVAIPPPSCPELLPENRQLITVGLLGPLGNSSPPSLNIPPPKTSA